MRATVGAALKKIAVALLTDPKVLKTVLGIVLGIIIIIIMPIVAIVSIFNGNIEIDTNRLQTMVIENLSAEEQAKLQFVEDTILFYVSHLEAKDERSMLPNAFLSTMKGMIAESDTRISRLLFKIAVELAVTMNVVAYNTEIDPVSLERLRGTCVNEVKRLNGDFSFDDAYHWQKD